MHWLRMPLCGAFFVLLLGGLSGCAKEVANNPLDAELARSSVQKAMQAWVDGKTLNDLKPGITIRDADWEQGRKLTSFEVLKGEETSDGSNLYIRVQRKFGSSGGGDAKVIYIVGTSPAVTIFPQE